MNELAKKLVDRLPYSIGALVARVPMWAKLGLDYERWRSEIAQQRPARALRARHLDGVRALMSHASIKTTFYARLYREHEIEPSDIRDYGDIASVPIVSKAELRRCPLEHRSVEGLALKKTNTGGTSGEPLDFYLDKQAYAREWAHMHTIWGRLGYRHADAKLTVRGKNIGRRYYRYSAPQNEFLVNAYEPVADHLATCRELIVGARPRWIHGYPSAVFSFLRELEQADPRLFERLVTNTRGVFLGSEYPLPRHREYIEKHCELKTISWYGHSEMAILAGEREPGSGVYYPFHTYGLAEAVRTGDSYRLIGTTTHNFASPLIRYDTGDLVEPRFVDGLLECFRIKEGRSAECVIDGKGRSISLTALLFGRHHDAFSHIDHVQVRPLSAGRIELLITAKKQRADWSHLFDFSHSYFDVTFTQIRVPVRTALGKVPLLVADPTVRCS